MLQVFTNNFVLSDAKSVAHDANLHSLTLRRSAHLVPLENRIPALTCAFPGFRWLAR